MWCDAERVRPGDDEPTRLRVRVTREGGDPRPDVIVRAEVDDPAVGRIEPESLTVIQYGAVVAGGAARVLDNLNDWAERLGVIDAALKWVFPGSDEDLQEDLKDVLKEEVTQSDRIAQYAGELATIWDGMSSEGGRAGEARHLLGINKVDAGENFTVSDYGPVSLSWKLQEAELAFLKLEVRRIRLAAHLGLGPSRLDADALELEVMNLGNELVLSVKPEADRILQLGEYLATCAERSRARIQHHV